MLNDNLPNQKKNQGKNLLISMLAADNEKEEGNKAQEFMELDKLVHYRNHPFKLYEGQRLDDMVRSIKELGVIVPIIVRPLADRDDRFEILSGHNRVNASRLAGLFEVPVIIKVDLSDEEAALIVTETNLVQRSFSDLSYSERAIALKAHVDAIGKQGKRNDIVNEINNAEKADEIRENGTCGLIDHKLKTRDKIADKYGLDARTVSRYLRLTELIKPLLNRLNNDEFGFYPAVDLSYLLKDEQETLNTLLDETSHKVDMKKAELLRSLSESQKLNSEKMEQILLGQAFKKPKSEKPKPIKVDHRIYSKYFAPETKQKEIAVIIDKALEQFFRKEEVD